MNAIDPDLDAESGRGLINGEDLFPGPVPVAGLTCRLYPTSQGLQGSPTLEGLVAALSDLPATA